MQPALFFPVILMLMVYVLLIALTFYFINYLVNKSLKLKKEQNDLLREIISKMDKK